MIMRKQRRTLYVGAVLAPVVLLTGCQAVDQVTTVGRDTVESLFETNKLSTFEGQYINSRAVIDRMPKAIEPQLLDRATIVTADQISPESLTGPGKRSLRMIGTLDVEAAASFPELQAYLEQRTARLMTAWPAEYRPDVTVVLSASDSKFPSAMPGRRLVVPMGLMLDPQMAQDRIVTAMLAHELAHILLSHNDGDANRDRTVLALSTVTDVAAFATGGQAEKIACQVRGGCPGTAVGDASREKKTRRPAGIYRHYVDRLVGSYWNRDEEFAADLLAQDLLYAIRDTEGAPDPNNVVEMLAILPEAESDLTAKVEASASVQFQRGLSNVFQEGGTTSTPGMPDLIGVAQDTLKSIADTIVDETSKDHPSIAERRKMAQEYRQRLLTDAGADVDLQKALDGGNTRDPLKELLQNRRTIERLETYRLAFQQFRALAGAPADATTSISRQEFLRRISIKRETDPFLLTIAGQIYSEQRQYREARTALTRAVRQPTAGLLPFETLARLYLKEGLPTNALEVIDQGEMRALYKPRVLPLRVEALRAAGLDHGPAYQECLGVLLPDIRLACRAAAGEQITEDDIKREPTLFGEFANNLKK